VLPRAAKGMDYGVEDHRRIPLMARVPLMYTRTHALGFLARVAGRRARTLEEKRLSTRDLRPGRSDGTSLVKTNICDTLWAHSWKGSHGERFNRFSGETIPATCLLTALQGKRLKPTEFHVR